VPFDLYISRASSFELVRGEPASEKPQGFFSKLFSSKQSASPPKPPSPISAEHFHALLASAPASKQSDSVYWVRHVDGDPWFAAERKAEGHVVLSASYSHHRFLRNLGYMFDQGLLIAEALQARLFEEVGGQEVTAQNFKELIDRNGSYVELQLNTWRSVMEMLDAQAKAPLEYPIGPIDAVSEFLVFHVMPERNVTANAMRSTLGQQVPGVKAELVQENAICLIGEDDKTLAKVLLRPDGNWQIWPSRGRAPFAQLAPCVVRAAECIHAEVRGQMELCGRPFDEALRREVRARIDGLSVDFYIWMQAANK